MLMRAPPGSNISPRGHDQACPVHSRRVVRNKPRRRISQATPLKRQSIGWEREMIRLSARWAVLAACFLQRVAGRAILHFALGGNAPCSSLFHDDTPRLLVKHTLIER